MNHTQHQHAIVLGGSMAGLLASSVLSRYFARVTLVERDRFPAEASARRGVPQGRHAHVLLARGAQLMEQFLPGLRADLLAHGALARDAVGDSRWFQNGHYKQSFVSHLEALILSRPLLETVIRRHVAALPNVTLREATAARELLTGGTDRDIIGVRVEDRESGEMTALAADLVVDATGRGSRAPQWLAALGYGAPQESTIRIDLGYATRVYRGIAAEKQIYVVAPAPPHESRGAVLMGIEDGHWILTLAGLLGDHPPADEAGFLAFARSLPAPDIAELIADAEPLGEIATYKFPANLRRHYEKMASFPRGYLVLGDALCSFNPVYGQGMTVSALEADALDRVLAADARPAGLAQRFYKTVTPIVDVPWSLAAGGDLAYAGVEGERTPLACLLNAYVNQIQLASAADQTVSQAFFRVANLVAPPGTLFRPAMLLRVLGHSLRRRLVGPPTTPAGEPARSAGTPPVYSTTRR